MHSIYVLKRHFGRRGLPVELVTEILDLAECWPRTTCYLQRSTEISSNQNDTEYSAEFSRAGVEPPPFLKVVEGEAFLLRTAPLALRTFTSAREERALKRWNSRLGTNEVPPSDKLWLPAREKHPCRKIVFEMLSVADPSQFCSPKCLTLPQAANKECSTFMPSKSTSTRMRTRGLMLVWIELYLT